MIEQSKNLMVQAGASWVLWLLVALSTLSLAVALDRARVFWIQGRGVYVLARDLEALLSQGNLEETRQRLATSRSAGAEIVLAGLAHWESGPAYVEKAMVAATGVKRSYLQRRLLFLGTVGNNAPFIGLLGTVIGIVGAFDELGKAQLAAATGSQIAPERVMATIAEALIVTAVGLIVAIPAVAAFNYFQGRIATVLSDAQTLGQVLLAHLERRRPAGQVPGR